ncbi:hypothetical protein PAXINDRAFT_99798 [Paxillus involutus ATCC 200175]|uniref:Uncharacterized protein n=1 Tax=Paxillus involutus ATCC 200175 TaxID=664439 RepID=A0A0C9U6F1_PAXIN|nr:hypothetical protein PAXINDRAFT_99798 [Paxillus involutus ATCC 200175]
MSHYTTTTASYILSKYSRSYSSPSSVQGGQTQVESDWQHFTNPVMTLFLDVKKSPSRELVSVRVRILWSMDIESNDMHADRREVVFEDLELLAFSSLPAYRASTAQSDQSLPLKAVYRDAVVGIRYLHPRTIQSGCQPTYRRFQITFSNALSASQFIDAVSPVCPCKANPLPNQINRHPMMLSGALTRAATTVPGPLLQYTAPQSTNAPSFTPALLQRQSTTVIPPRNPTFTPSVPSEHVVGSSPFPSIPGIAASSALEASLSSDDIAYVTCSETSHATDAPVGSRNDVRPSNLIHPAPSSLPDSSQPSSSNHSSAMPPPAPRSVARSIDGQTQTPSRRMDTGAEGSYLLASLSELPSLYNLSRTDLESLVSQVVREDGFANLLDSLDSLWRIKGFLAR